MTGDYKLNEPKFINIYCGDGIEIGMPEVYYEKIKFHCYKKGWIIDVYIKMILEKCNYIMSDFYKTIEAIEGDFKLNEPKFINIYCGDGIEIGMPEVYYEKIKFHCYKKGWILEVYIKMRLEECKYIMSDFYKTIEAM